MILTDLRQAKQPPNNFPPRGLSQVARRLHARPRDDQARPERVSDERQHRRPPRGGRGRHLQGAPEAPRAHEHHRGGREQPGCPRGQHHVRQHLGSASRGPEDRDARAGVRPAAGHRRGRLLLDHFGDAGRGRPLMQRLKSLCACDLKNVVRGELQVPGTSSELEARIKDRLQPLVGEDAITVQVTPLGAALQVGRSAFIVARD